MRWHSIILDLSAGPVDLIRFLFLAGRIFCSKYFLWVPPPIQLHSSNNYLEYPPGYRPWKHLGAFCHLFILVIFLGRTDRRHENYKYLHLGERCRFSFEFHLPGCDGVGAQQQIFCAGYTVIRAVIFLFLWQVAALGQTWSWDAQHETNNLNDFNSDKVFVTSKVDA